MLDRIHKLFSKGQDFAFETTLASKSYRNFIIRAKENGCYVKLIYFWLQSPDLAIRRVETRVKEGGHSIPKNVIIRRYHNGLKNFFEIFEPIVNEWIFIDSSGSPYELIASKINGTEVIQKNAKLWHSIIKTYK